MKTLCSLLLIILSTGSFCQVSSFSIAKDQHYFKDTISFSQLFDLETDKEVTALKLSCLDRDEIAINLKYHSYQEELIASDDHHLEFPQNFVILLKPTTSISLSGDYQGRMIIECFFSENGSKDHTSYRYKADECAKPSAITPETWRAGLDDPTPGRNEVLVKHCIIHHAASNNSHTDFTYVVRNIYLLHTQTNGWDDIGYNYLIAPNGDVYIGRDSLGSS